MSIRRHFVDDFGQMLAEAVEQVVAGQTGMRHKRVDRVGAKHFRKSNPMFAAYPTDDGTALVARIPLGYADGISTFRRNFALSEKPAV